MSLTFILNLAAATLQPATFTPILVTHVATAWVLTGARKTQVKARSQGSISQRREDVPGNIARTSQETIPYLPG